MQIWVLSYGEIGFPDEYEVFATRELAVACLRRYIDECLDVGGYPDTEEVRKRDAATRKQLPTLDDDAFLNRVFGCTPEGEPDPNGGIANVLDLELQLFDAEVQGLPAKAEAA
jgi:hypothetical protein